MTTKMGRPKIEIDWSRLNQACLVGCTLLECAGILGVDDNTLMRAIHDKYGLTFGQYRDEKEAPKLKQLRERLWDAALDPKSGPVDRIWVSKNKLNWTDKQEVQQKVDPAVLDMLERQLALSRQLQLPIEVIDVEG